MKRYRPAHASHLLMKTLSISFLLVLIPSVALAQQPPAQRSESRTDSGNMARPAKRGTGKREGRLKPGDSALDFDLKKLRSQERVRLSDFKDKRPVALVFGSYT